MKVVVIGSGSEALKVAERLTAQHQGAVVEIVSPDDAVGLGFQGQVERSRGIIKLHPPLHFSETIGNNRKQTRGERRAAERKRLKS